MGDEGRGGRGSTGGGRRGMEGGGRGVLEREGCKSRIMRKLTKEVK